MGERANTGDRSTEFVSRLTAVQFALHAYIAFLIGNPDDAKDVLQETNLTLWKESAAYDFGRPFLAWAKTVAYYQVKTFRTLQSRDRLVFDEELLERVAAAADEEADLHRMIDALERCFERLSLTQRSVLKARYFSGKAVALIAKTLGCSADSVSMLLFRIRDKLGQCVELALREEAPHAP